MATAPTRPSWVTDNQSPSSGGGGREAATLASPVSGGNGYGIPRGINNSPPQIATSNTQRPSCLPTVVRAAQRSQDTNSHDNNARAMPNCTTSATASATQASKKPSIPLPSQLTLRTAVSSLKGTTTSSQSVTLSTSQTVAQTLTTAGSSSSEGSSEGVNIARQLLEKLNKGELNGAASRQLIEGMKKGGIRNGQSPSASTRRMEETPTPSAPASNQPSPQPSPVIDTQPIASCTTGSSLTATNQSSSNHSATAAAASIPSLPTQAAPNSSTVSSPVVQSIRVVSPLTDAQMEIVISLIEAAVTRETLFNLCKDPNAFLAKFKGPMEALSASDSQKLLKEVRSRFNTTRRLSPSNSSLPISNSTGTSISSGAVLNSRPPATTSAPISSSSVPSLQSTAPRTNSQQAARQSISLQQAQTQARVARANAAQSQTQPARNQARVAQANTGQSQTQPAGNQASTSTPVLPLPQPSTQPPTRRPDGDSRVITVNQQTQPQSQSATSIQPLAQSRNNQSAAQQSSAQMPSAQTLNLPAFNAPQGSIVIPSGPLSPALSASVGSQAAKANDIYKNWVVTMQEIAPQFQVMMNHTMTIGEEALRRTTALVTESQMVIVGLIAEKAQWEKQHSTMMAQITTLNDEKANLLKETESFRAVGVTHSNRANLMARAHASLSQDKTLLQTQLLQLQQEAAANLIKLQNVERDLQNQNANTEAKATAAAAEEVADLRQKLQKRTDRMKEIEAERLDSERKHAETTERNKKDFDQLLAAAKKSAEASHRRMETALNEKIKDAEDRAIAARNETCELQAQLKAKIEETGRIAAESETAKAAIELRLQETQAQLRDVSDELEATKAELATTSAGNTDDENECLKSLVNFAETIRKVHGLPPFVITSGRPAELAASIRDSFKDTLKQAQIAVTTPPAMPSTSSSIALEQSQKLLEAERKRSEALEDSISNIKRETESALARQKKELEREHEEALKELENHVWSQYNEIKKTAELGALRIKSLEDEVGDVKTTLEERNASFLKKHKEIMALESEQRALQRKLDQLSKGSIAIASMTAKDKDDDFEIIAPPPSSSKPTPTPTPKSSPPVPKTQRPTGLASQVIDRLKSSSSNSPLKNSSSTSLSPSPAPASAPAPTASQSQLRAQDDQSSGSESGSGSRKRPIGDDEDDLETIQSAKKAKPNQGLAISPSTKINLPSSPKVNLSSTASASAVASATNSARASPAPGTVSLDPPEIAEKFIKLKMGLLVAAKERVNSMTGKKEVTGEKICRLCFIDKKKRARLEGRVVVNDDEIHGEAPINGRTDLTGLVKHMMDNHREYTTKLRLKRIKEGKKVA